MRKREIPPDFDYCQICGDPAGLITPGKRQFCSIVCMEKGRSGMKTKPVCPHCKADLTRRDGPWWVCDTPKCFYKGVYPDRVEVLELKEKDGDRKG